MSNSTFALIQCKLLIISLSFIFSCAPRIELEDTPLELAESRHFQALSLIESQSQSGSTADRKITVDREIFELLLASSNGGYSDSYRFLAELYLEGRGTDADIGKGASWLQEAAIAGDSESMFLLAELMELEQKGLLSGLADTASDLYEKSAELGYAPAQYKVAQQYLSDENLVNDLQAEVWLDLAANEGHADAQYALAKLYRDDQRSPIDIQEADKWLQAAAENNVKEAQFELAMTHATNSSSVSQRSAEVWLSKSSKNGYPAAQFELAMLLTRDKTREPEEAIEWLTASAEQGYKPAECELGRMHYRGYLVAQDFSLARQWFERASQNEAGLSIEPGLMRSDCPQEINVQSLR